MNDKIVQKESSHKTTITESFSLKNGQEVESDSTIQVQKVYKMKKDLKEKYGYNKEKKISDFNSIFVNNVKEITQYLPTYSTQYFDVAWYGDDGKVYIGIDISNGTITNENGVSTSTDNSYRYSIWRFDKVEDLNNSMENVGNLKNEEKLLKSSSKVLQSSIATWYKTLRVVALVGLLSVLVYVGIRIILSSTSQEKAKYKNMIKDWIIAICLLFVLHYIMSFTIQITNSILGIFNSNPNIVGADGTDVLMTKIRQGVGDIEEGSNFRILFSKIVIYIVLVIFTVMFVLQYLKRVVMLAFLTMIAPLITLTYPLDKIKDGQAQAFSMWIREYVFNALLPVIHIILYYMLVGSALDFITNGDNWLYAIVAVGFLIPAEKFFRKMFGFDKASSVGQLGAAAGGALVMNAINKLGHRSGKQAAGSSDGSSKGANRTASSNALNITPGEGGAPGGSQAPAPGGDGLPVGPQAPAPGGSGAPGGSQAPVPGGSGVPGNISGSKPKIGGFKAGAAAVGRRYFNKNTAKKVGKMARKGIIGGLGAATLGTVGLAAGVATGDLSNAFKYGAAGVGAGYMGANYAGDKILAGEKNVRETFMEGYIGQDEYNNRKSDKEFYSSKEFRDMVNNNSLLTNKTGLGRTEEMKKAVQTYRDNGITDTSKITSAMKMGLSPEEGAYAIRLAGIIGRSGWNNPKTREDFERRYKANIPNNNGRANAIWNSIESLL